MQDRIWSIPNAEWENNLSTFYIECIAGVVESGKRLQWIQNTKNNLELSFIQWAKSVA